MHVVNGNASCAAWCMSEGAVRMAELPAVPATNGLWQKVDSVSIAIFYMILRERNIHYL